MRVFRPTLVFSLALALSGCGYIHFGKLPKEATALGDAALSQAYSNLSTEHKILKQELALARKEGDTLRAALERGSGGGSPEVVAQLNETARELATLRASYARLQAERAAAPNVTNQAGSARLAELEDQLATSLRNYTQLQEENTRLRTDLDRTRTENSTLATQLKSAVAQNDQAQAALSQLNAELLAEKEARSRAEQAGAATRTQLEAVMARRESASANPATSPAVSGGAKPGEPASAPLQIAKAPPAESSAVAELRISPQKLAEKVGGPAARPAAQPGGTGATPAPASRTHVVQAGDTLERIATKYYGDPKKWVRLYAANNDQLRDGRPLRPGMELEIPEN